MRYEKRFLILMLAILFVFFFGSYIEPSISYAHSGRTDSSGGHHDYQNKSGLGSYHYHCGGNPPHLHENGICPYSSQGSQSQSNSSVNSSGDSSLRADSSQNTSTIKEVAAKSLTIELAESLEVGNRTWISSEITPEDTTCKGLTYYSSDDSIATVSANGNVKGVSPGEAVISAVTSNGIRKEVKITIYEVKPNEIECNDKLEMIVGDEQEIEVTVLPENSSNKEYTVSVENQEILEYSDNKITAIKEGSTDLHIETWNGIKKDIHVKVGIIPVEELEIMDATGYIIGNVVDINGNISLEAKVKPSDATYQKAKWESSNPNVIEIEDGKFHIKNTGKVTLTCSTHDNMSETIDIMVVNRNAINTIGGIMGLCAGVGAIYILIVRERKQAN